MKKFHFLTLTIAAVGIVSFSLTDSRAAETNNPAARIGTYDSRAVAYAWFWSARHQKQLHELMQSAREARAAADTNRFQKLDSELRQHQAEMHREVFSTAPAIEALAEVKDRLPQIEKTAGVATLLSQWDEQALKIYPGAEKVDVTDALVREFITPTPQQQKVLAEMKKVKPLPLDQCEELIRKGKI